MEISFLIQASFTIVTYDRQNMFIIQATGRESFFQLISIHFQFLHSSHIQKKKFGKKVFDKKNFEVKKVIEVTLTLQNPFSWAISITFYFICKLQTRPVS